MSSFNSSPENKNGNPSKMSKQGQINRVSKKGKTLGAQHASHGDSNIERSKTPKNKDGQGRANSGE